MVSVSTKTFHQFNDLPEVYSVGDVYLDQLVTVNGMFYIYENNYTWNPADFDGYQPVIKATDGNLFVWESIVDDDGSFAFNIPAGDYDFETEESLLNVEIIEYALQSDITDEITQINLTAMPNPAQTNMMVFLDSSNNMSFDEGVPVYAEFILKSLITGEEFNFIQENYTQLGVVETTLLPGHTK